MSNIIYKKPKPCEIIKLDKYTGKIQTPTLLLMNRSFDIIGKISRFEDWNISLAANETDEIVFHVHKYADGILCPVWNDLTDLKIVDVSGFGRFEISVNYTDSTETVKSVHGISLETELAQIGLYEFHVNDDDAADMAITEYSRDNYDSKGNFIPTTFYNPDDEKHSLLHRVLADKAPHWSIGYVTPYIALDEETQPEESSKFQRTYTVDGDSVYDFLTGTVAEESNVIFVFDTINRQINCYSLCDCIDQKTGKPMLDKDGNEVTGIGEDTFVFISKNKLANEITISSNKDNVKNCFRIEGGDDIITDMVRAVNMNGSNYIYQFADFQYNDMPEALVKTITEYNNNLSKEENTYYGNGDMDKFLNGSLALRVTSELEAVTALCVCKSNRIATSNLDISGLSYPQYWYIVTSEDSKELYISEYISEIEKTPNATVTNAFDTMGIYSRLCLKYDELAYLESSMMPDVDIKETTAEEQYNIMKDALKDNSMIVGVSSLNKYDNNLFVGVSNNVEAMANVLIDARYKAEIIKETASYNDDDKDNIYWTGNIRITRTADETDYYPKTEEQIKTCFDVKINDDELTFTRQKIEKALHKGSMLDIDFDVANMDDTGIRNYFNKYSLNRLKSFYDGYNSCLSILMQLDTDSSVRKDLYETYYNRMRIISNPPTMDDLDAVPGVLDIRQQQVDGINSEIINIITEQIEFQEKWDFKKCLDDNGEDFYKIFCSYRREDVYSNSNYVSDGLTTSECLAKAKELIEAATKEAKKACVLQRTVSTSLNNLFALPEFEPFYETFALYNYIRIRTEDEILKLRLIGIDFSGDSAEKIEVTFSEQIESIDGTLSDLQSIIHQAKSMATSYPSTALQAKQGSEANDEIADMHNNGLNAEKTMFANNDNNEVTITQSGIICKRMDDEGAYDGKQLRITGNVMAFTDDDWKSVRMAIGETAFDDPTEETTEKTKKQAYGIIADNIVGKLIAGDTCFIGNKENNVMITGDGIDIMNGSISLSNDEYSIEIDPKHNLGSTLDDYLFCIRNKSASDEVIMGVDTSGNGHFKGTVDATSITAKEQYYVNSSGQEIPLIRGSYNPFLNRGWTVHINFEGRGIFLHNSNQIDIESSERLIEAIIYTDIFTCSSKKAYFHGDLDVEGSIHTYSGEITTSDRNLKDNIKSLTEKHIKFFSLLQPVSFTFKEGTSGRTHIGFISQDVEEAMYKAGLTDLDFAGFCKRAKTITKTDIEGFKTKLLDLDENGNVQYIYSLRYDEFIALNTHMIQHTIEKVEKLEQENKDLKQRVEYIERMLF